MSGFQSPWYFDAFRAIEKLAESGKPFTSDDVVEIAGEPSHFNQVGKVFTEAQNLRLIKRTGNSPQSRRPSRRKARVQQWVGYSVDLASLSDTDPAPEERQGALL